MKRVFLLALSSLATMRSAQPQFNKLRQIQFIAASVDPTSADIQATAGHGAEAWGIWRVDPGPRGVMLTDFKSLEASGGIARAGWRFNPKEWWLEEHGLIMEAPD